MLKCPKVLVKGYSYIFAWHDCVQANVRAMRISSSHHTGHPSSAPGQPREPRRHWPEALPSAGKEALGISAEQLQRWLQGFVLHVPVLAGVLAGMLC